MARSPAKGGTGSVTEATTLIFPKQSVWQDLAKTKRETKKRAASHTGIYGSAVKQAVEKDHVDRKALGIVLKLDEMEDDDLHVTVHHMIDGMKKLGILKRAMAQEEMFDEHKIDGDALDEVQAAGRNPRKGSAGKKPPKGGGGAPRASNVVPIGDAARQVAEAAGADKS